jgi:Notch-like protein
LYCASPNVCACIPGNWTGPSCSTPICHPQCGAHQKCVSPGVCACDDGWINYPSCDVAICSSPVCGTNEQCIAPDQCVCISGYYDDNGVCDKIYYCDSVESYNETVCNSNGDCVSDNNCQCDEGWAGSDCLTPTCTETCVHGTCTAPNTCTCNPYWKGADCNIPDCFTLSCNDNQYCDGSNATNVHCECEPGWSGTFCDVPLCSPICDAIKEDCVAPDICKCKNSYYYNIQTSTCEKIYYCDNIGSNNHSVCNGNGDCIADHNCDCDSGYSGFDCSNINCDPTCINGTCTEPNKCTCNDGWIGDDCSVAVCEPPCKYGNCTLPNECTCYNDNGWSGNDCSIPVCDPVCSAHGTCVHSEGQNYCCCDEGWGGTTCQFNNLTVSDVCYVDGKLVPWLKPPECTDPYVCYGIPGDTWGVCGRWSHYFIFYRESHGVCVEDDTCLCYPVFTGKQCRKRYWKYH